MRKDERLDKKNRPHCLFIILLIFVLSGCGNNTDLQEPGNETPETQGQSIQGQEPAEIKYGNDVLIGTWQNNPFGYAGGGKRYHFYDDGTYLFEYGSPFGKNPYKIENTISESGKWDIKNDTLTLALERKITIENGEIFETVQSHNYSYYVLVNGVIKVTETRSLDGEKYIENNILRDAKESTNGKLMVAINGMEYWKVHDSPDAYQGKREYKDGEAYRPTADEQAFLLTGTWHPGSAVGSLLDSRYHFYDDGTYIFEYSNYDTTTRILSESGTWSINDAALTVYSKVTIHGGEESTEAIRPIDQHEYAIVNGTIKVTEENPPEKKVFVLGRIYQDSVEDGNGQFTVVINGVRYWRLSDNPDAYLNDFIEDGDIFRPWP